MAYCQDTVESPDVVVGSSKAEQAIVSARNTKCAPLFPRAGRPLTYIVLSAVRSRYCDWTFDRILDVDLSKAVKMLIKFVNIKATVKGSPWSWTAHF